MTKKRSGWTPSFSFIFIGHYLIMMFCPFLSQANTAILVSDSSPQILSNYYYPKLQKSVKEFNQKRKNPYYYLNKKPSPFKKSDKKFLKNFIQKNNIKELSVIKLQGDVINISIGKTTLPFKIKNYHQRTLLIFNKEITLSPQKSMASFFNEMKIAIEQERLRQKNPKERKKKLGHKPWWNSFFISNAHAILPAIAWKEAGKWLGGILLTAGIFTAVGMGAQKYEISKSEKNALLGAEKSIDDSTKLCQDILQKKVTDKQKTYHLLELDEVDSQVFRKFDLRKLSKSYVEMKQTPENKSIQEVQNLTIKLRRLMQDVFQYPRSEHYISEVECDKNKVLKKFYKICTKRILLLKCHDKIRQIVHHSIIGVDDGVRRHIQKGTSSDPNIIQFEEYQDTTQRRSIRK